MNGQLKIDQMFAFIAKDLDGSEGIPAVIAPGGTAMPLVGADMDRVQSLLPIAQKMATERNITITLVKFSQRDDIIVIKP